MLLATIIGVRRHEEHPFTVWSTRIWFGRKLSGERSCIAVLHHSARSPSLRLAVLETTPPDALPLSSPSLVPVVHVSGLRGQLAVPRSRGVAGCVAASSTIGRGCLAHVEFCQQRALCVRWRQALLGRRLHIRGELSWRGRLSERCLMGSGLRRSGMQALQESCSNRRPSRHSEPSPARVAAFQRRPRAGRTPFLPCSVGEPFFRFPLAVAAWAT